jgi:hypothetical protein
MPFCGIWGFNEGAQMVIDFGQMGCVAGARVGLVALFVCQLGAQYEASEPPRGSRGLGPDQPQNYSFHQVISFKVVLEGGAALSVAPLVLPHPGVSPCRVESSFLDGTVRLRFALGLMPGPCSLWKVAVPGYQTCSGLVNDCSVITLKRLGEHEGSEVSFTVLRAPAGARKAYDRGEAAMAQGKWLEAEKHFGDAVAVYPDYATAWSELGAALMPPRPGSEWRN